MPILHSKLSASISKRWMQGFTPNGKELGGCPGSITLSAKVIEPPKSNAAADTGTAAHEIGEKCLIKGITPEEFRLNHPKDYITVKGQDDSIVKIPITDKMIEDVSFYTNTIWSDIEFYEKKLKTEAKIYVEEEFSLNSIFTKEDKEYLINFLVESDFYPDITDEFDAEEVIDEFLQMFGTNDCSVFYPKKALFIYDYKNGRWPVEAEDNTQFLYYAIGAAIVHNWDFDYVEMSAIQPNSMAEDKNPRWRITKDELKEWVNIFHECAIKTITEPNNFKSGEHCHFCPARGMCEQEASDSMKSAQIDFEEDFQLNDDNTYSLSLSPIGSLTYEKMKKVIDNADLIINFVNSVRASAKTLLENGNSEAREQLGYKLVEKPKNRKIVATDEEIIVYCTDELLLDISDITEPLPKYGKLLSMTKLEKVIGSENMKQFIDRPDPEVIMVPESDTRQEVVVNPGQDFIEDYTDSDII